MKRRSIVEGVALVGVAMILATGAGAAWAGAPHATRTTAQALNPAPRTWHVIAGFTQALPRGNDSTEAVNQFYPRMLTIYAGDAVQWTVNAFDEPHTVTFGPDRLLRPLEDPQHQLVPQVVNGKNGLPTGTRSRPATAPSRITRSSSRRCPRMGRCGTRKAFRSSGPMTTTSAGRPGCGARPAVVYGAVPPRRHLRL